jgi:Amt family ammonium transporter
MTFTPGTHRLRGRFSWLMACAVLLALAPAASPAASRHLQSPEPAAATDPAAARATDRETASPTLEQRVADLEAYLNNAGRETSPRTRSRVAGAGPGHNAWMMTSAALVLFMTLPGLALFYGGLVRSKNVLSILAQCIGIAGLVTVLWWAAGYSLVFGSPAAERSWSVLGTLEHAFLKSVGAAPNPDYAAWVSQSVFCMFQMMFAIITPALIVGAVAERMRFAAIMVFVFFWMFLVYFPLAHMVWGIDGMMNGVWNARAPIKAIDFAGGTVVHMSSGWSALVLCLLLGRRNGLDGKSTVPHNLVLTVIGTGMLWVGWYGFNAGSAVASDGIAANAFMTTTLAAAVASHIWAAAEWVFRGKPTVLGFCSGAVAGLVTVTPGCGFVNATGAVVMGIVGGLVPFWAVYRLKPGSDYDDALDTFGIHAVGGTAGALMTGLLATTEVNPNLATNLAALVGGALWIEQLKAMAVTLALSVAGTLVAVFLTRALVGLRAPDGGEQLGMDISEHGEEAYAGFQTVFE